MYRISKFQGKQKIQLSWIELYMRMSPGKEAWTGTVATDTSWASCKEPSPYFPGYSNKFFHESY